MARDRYKYFRVEAADLLERLVTGLGSLQHANPRPGTVRELLRVAHTLKGAAHVVKSAAIAAAAHSLEEEIGPYSEDDRVPIERLSALLAITDLISHELSALSQIADAESSAPPSVKGPAAALESTSEGEDTISSVRIELVEMDRVLESLEAMSLRVSSLAERLTGLERVSTLSNALAAQLLRRQPERTSLLGIADPKIPLAQELRDQVNTVERKTAFELERLQRELIQVRELASQLRLVSIRALFVPLERAVRTSAELLHKTVRFEMIGGEQRVDAQVIAAVREALIHLVRNAVAHGMEAADERRAAGKSPAGTVRVSIERRGRRMAFICEDDGRGIDLSAIRRVAVEKGLVSAQAAEALPQSEILKFALAPGVTTATSVNSVAGRGIGLDVVRDAAARLKGTIQIVDDFPVGTKIELVVPTSFLSMSAVLVEAGGTVAALPSDSVDLTMIVNADQIVETGGAEAILSEGQPIPFMRLTDILARAGMNPATSSSRLAVVLRSGELRTALAVDRLLGISNIIVRVLPEFVGVPAFVAGATLDSKGTPQMVLDPEALARTGKNVVTSRPRIEHAPRLPFLVIDDSLTTRMLEQSILESAGYRVDTANSAEEALQKARNVSYGLFLVDVEMPGMDGFDFIDTIRKDPGLRHVPAILVTSRSSPEDRERGIQAGANDYVVKSEFDQNYLLQRIEQLAISQ